MIKEVKYAFGIFFRHITSLPVSFTHIHTQIYEAESKTEMADGHADSLSF